MINNKAELIEKFKDKYPQQIFDSSGKVDKKLINTPGLIDACEGISDLIEIKYNDKNFVFYLESFGQLSPKEIVAEAANAIKESYVEFQEALK